MTAVQVVIEGQYDGQVINNVLGLLLDGDVATESQLQTVALQVANSWEANVLPALVTAYQVQTYRATDLGTGLTVVRADVASGVANEQGLPAVLVGKVKHSTATPGVRGRTGISALPTSYIQDANTNFIDTASVVALNNLWQEFIGDLEAGLVGMQAQHAVISRVDNGVERPEPVAIPVTASTFQGKFGTRRSRIN